MPIAPFASVPAQSLLVMEALCAAPTNKGGGWCVLSELHCIGFCSGIAGGGDVVGVGRRTSRVVRYVLGIGQSWIVRVIVLRARCPHACCQTFIAIDMP